MVGKIPVRYRPQAAKLLRLCYESRLVDDTEPLRALGVALVDDGRMSTARLRSSPTAATQTEASAKCQALKVRLQSRCWGLLELKADSDEFINKGWGCFCQADPDDEQHDVPMDSTVQFMHRTVFEFLSQPRVWELECLTVGDDEFNASATLAYISLELARFSLSFDEELSRAYFKDVRLYGVLADDSSPDLIALVLLEMDAFLQGMAANTSCGPLPDMLQQLKSLVSYSDGHETGGRWHTSFFFALESGMINFVSSYCQLQSLPSFPQSRRPLLLHVLNGYVAQLLCSQEHLVSPSAVRYLLESVGHDPNEHVSSESRSSPHACTPWQDWLLKMNCADISAAIAAAEVTGIFIRAGADAEVVEGLTGETLPQRIRRLFVNFGIGRDVKLKSRRFVVEIGHQLLSLVESSVTLYSQKRQRIDIEGTFDGSPAESKKRKSRRASPELSCR